MLGLKTILQFKKQISKDPRFNTKAELIRCMGDPTCLKILYILSKEKEVCPSDLVNILNLSMPAISHQLSRLRQMKIVVSERMGKEICYSFSNTKAAILVNSLVKKIVW